MRDGWLGMAGLPGQTALSKDPKENKSCGAIARVCCIRALYPKQGFGMAIGRADMSSSDLVKAKHWWWTMTKRSRFKENQTFS